MAGVFKTVVTFMVLVFAAAVVVVAEVEDHHDVGGDLEWTRPIDLEYYTKWAAAQTFRLGDKLEFEFATGRHDVAIVTKDAYENCETKTKPLNLMTVSPVKINLNKTGEHYYICTFGDHCRFGQKLAINVVAAGASAGETTTTPPNSGSSGTTTTTTTTTPARNTASSLGGATFLFLLSFSLCFSFSYFNSLTPITMKFYSL